MQTLPMRAAVVGHLEWVEFIRVETVPRASEIVHALDWWAECGGGGAGAALQLAKLADEAVFFTAVGDDELGRRALRELQEQGVRVEAALRDTATRRAITHVDSSGERTITVVGERAGPRGEDPLPWDELAGADAVYFTAGDVGALRHARRAGVVVATARTLPVLAEARVQLDVLVGSALDPSEAYRAGDLDPAPRAVVTTEGAAGGTYEVDGVLRRYPATPPPGPVVDRYGAGDSFAAGLAFALGAGCSFEDAVAVAARCGAAVITGRGPSATQLDRSQVGDVDGGGASYRSDS